MGGKISKFFHRLVRPLRAVHTWQLLLIFIPLCFLTATLLRFNHLEMVSLRRAVLDADVAEDDAEIARTLGELRDYVFSNVVVNVTEENGVQRIFLGTGPFYLEHTYLRAANAAIAAAENTLVDDHNPNGNIYEAVRQICQPRAIANGWAWTSPGYIECWTSELAKYPTSDELSPNVITAAVPSTELYRLSYASPLFSFTPAGIALLVTALHAIAIIIRLLIWLILKIALLFA